MYQYDIGSFSPPNFLRIPDGKKFLEFDGARGFETVMGSRAAPAGGDPALRIYRNTKFGDLIGQDVAPLVSDKPGSAVAIVNGAIWTNVSLDSHFVPWAYSETFVKNISESHDVAVARHGRIIGVSRVIKFDDSNAGLYILNAAPQLVLPGSELPQVYFIDGTPGHASLDPITTHG